jgi:hypothetical protein
MKKVFIALAFPLSMIAAESTLQYFFVHKKDVDAKLAEMRCAQDKIQGIDAWNWKSKHKKTNIPLPQREIQKSFKPSIDPLD